MALIGVVYIVTVALSSLDLFLMETHASRTPAFSRTRVLSFSSKFKEPSCINTDGTVLKLENDEGVCTNNGGCPINLQLGQKCGGKFDYLGTCMPQSRCYVKVGKKNGVCAKYGMLNCFITK